MLNILYLDDEVMLCKIFKEFLQSDTINVATYIEANEAIEACAANPPDIIFLDYRLRDTTGDIVAKELDSPTPKYLITGDLSTKTEYKFDGIISKPFKFSDVRKVVDQYL